MSDWGELISASGAPPVWKGSLIAVDAPRITVWWMAWAGDLNVLHFGVTGIMNGREKDDEQTTELTVKLYEGMAATVWRTVGGRLGYEVQPLENKTQTNGAQVFSGKIVVKAYQGKLFDPLMQAIERMRGSVRSRGAAKT